MDAEKRFCADCGYNQNNTCSKSGKQVSITNQACGDYKPNTERLIKDKALEIMTTGDPVKFVLDVHQSLHVGDLNLAKSLLLSIGIQSVLNSDGIHPKISGESGKGKTHCCKAMAHLVPKEYLIASALSDKAVYYLNLRSSSVVYSDDVNLSENLESVIKRATSNYQTGDVYTTVDKGKPKILTIPPRVAWWLTSVDDDQSMQLLNRQFGGGVDDSQDQDDRVAQFQLRQAANGDVGLPENENVEVCREIIRQQKQKPFLIKIPFADGIKWNDKGNRRNLPIFLDILKSFAVLRFKQRPAIEGYLLAAIEDFEDAKKLYCSRAENQTLKLTEVELKLCRKLHELTRLQGECDSKTLERAMGLSHGRIHQLIHGRKDKPESGLLNKVKNFRVEKKTVRINEEETTTKNFYSIEEFDILGSYDSVVELSEKIRTDYYHYYMTVTQTVTNKTIDSNNTVTTVTHNINIESNSTDNNSNGFPSFSEFQKTCNNCNSQATDNDSECNSASNSSVNAAQHNGNTKNGSIKVRFLKKCPKFLAITDRKLGPFKPGDTVVLGPFESGDFALIPQVNAQALIKRRVAVEVEVAPV